MRSLWIFVPLLGACNKDKEEPVPEDTGPTEEPGPPLAMPYVGFVMAIDQSTGTLKSTCQFRLELKDENGTTVASADSVAGAATGRQWVALPLQVNKQYTALAIWQDCTNFADGQGQEESQIFSGADGDLLAWHYNGIDAHFDVVQQEIDFEGGIVEAQFYEGVDPTSLVASLPSVTVEALENDNWRFTWDDTLSPAQVLAALSVTRDFEDGDPIWIERPTWW